MDETALAAALQFGAAGLIGWMWLTERRAAAERERQLCELHDRLMQERPQIATLMQVVRENTRALVSLEAGQRALTATLSQLTLSLAGTERRAPLVPEHTTTTPPGK